MVQRMKEFDEYDKCVLSSWAIEVAASLLDSASVVCEETLLLRLVSCGGDDEDEGNLSKSSSFSSSIGSGNILNQTLIS
jgi:hypothetical protein